MALEEGYFVEKSPHRMASPRGATPALGLLFALNSRVLLSYDWQKSRGREMKKLALVLFFGTLLVGCEILGPDNNREQNQNATRTYPEALDLPSADLNQLLDGVHANGHFNLTAFVVGISECPPDFACLVADHKQVSGNPETDGPSLMIATEKPSQLDLDGHYVLSIDVFGERFPESNQSQFVMLLAYSDVD